MAARTVGGAAGTGEVAHPLLRTRLVSSRRGAVYGVRLAAADSWLVDEHRMLGHPVVPGTGHLEMVRAAFADRTGVPLVELREVTFATPIVLVEDQPKDVRVVLEAAGDGFTFAVASGYGDGSTWQWHSTGLVGPATAGPRRAHDLPAIIARLRDAGRMTDTGPMSFGPRSRCLERMWVGDNEFLAELVLPDEFVGDLATLPLHPSMMDIAAAYVGLSVGTELRIPMSYGRLAMFAPLPQRVFSYHRYPRADSAGRETVSGEFVLMDAAGTELVVVEDFVLKRVADLQTRLITARDGSSDEIARYRIPDLADAAPTASGAGGFLRRQWDLGIRSAEGVAAFQRILSTAQFPQVVVSTRDLDTLIAEAGATGDTERDPRVDRHTRAHPRPNLLTAYAEPRDETERRLARVWQDLLGVDRIGVHDHFFELGGHSLLGIQLAARLRDDLGLELPLGTLFEALTIAELAVVVDAREAAHQAGPRQQVGDGSA